MRKPIPRDTMGTTPPPPDPGGRPEVEAGLTPDVLQRLDARAAATGKSRADTIRDLIDDGLDNPGNLADLAAERPLKLIDQAVDGDLSYGISVHSDGHTFWISRNPHGWIIAHSEDPNLIAAFQGAALLTYQRIALSDVTPDLSAGPDSRPFQPAFPGLIAAGQAILSDIAAQEKFLRKQLRTHWPRNHALTVRD